MKREELTSLINAASGRAEADLVIRGARIINVFSGRIHLGDIAMKDGLIAGVGEPGEYEGKEEVDADGLYAAPGFIDSHIHIESSYVSPEEFGRMLVPHGATTVLADPHEIVNVCGQRGLEYMIDAAKGTKLSIRFMMPSCVPATPFEHAGAVLEAEDMEAPLQREELLGLGEFMDFPGIVNSLPRALAKVALAHRVGKPIDGHASGLAGKALNAYAAAGIVADHEADSLEEVKDRLERGLYVMLREGSACHDLRRNIQAVTPANSRRFLLCSDDRQPETMLTLGHLDNHLKLCVEEGVDPVTAIQMATLNAAECFGMKDRGAIAPGRRADIVLLEDLEDFRVSKVWIRGELCAEGGVYLPPVTKHSIQSVQGSVNIGDFCRARLSMNLKSNRVNTIRILPGGVVTARGTAEVKVDKTGDFVWDPAKDVVKISVIERHHGTGHVANAFLEGYGIKHGAVAVSVAHDSHNIIAVGVDNREIEAAVKAIQVQEGGIALVKDGQVIECMPMPIAGLMSDQSGEWVRDRLEAIQDKAYNELGISRDVEPIMTLTFMSLPVIPEVKLTDMGLFDVEAFRFLPLEAE